MFARIASIFAMENDENNTLFWDPARPFPRWPKKLPHQPPPDALVKIEITLASTDNVPRP